MRHLFGFRFIDKKNLLMARKFFRISTENKPVRGRRKKYNIPDVNWLKENWQYSKEKESCRKFSVIQWKTYANHSIKKNNINVLKLLTLGIVKIHNAHWVLYTWNIHVPVHEERFLHCSYM